MRPATERDLGVHDEATWVRRALRVVRQIVGAPDYEAYLEHCRRAGHPPALGERGYVEEFFEARGGRGRCC